VEDLQEVRAGHSGGDIRKTLWRKIMSLTRDNDSDGDYGWWYDIPDDYSVLATKRARRCSCGKPLKVGDKVMAHHCYRPANGDVEERIYGDEVPLATRYLCEECGDQAMNLRELGYCVSPTDKVMNLLREYVQMTKGE
jgi:predicted RNA-binding Zn-ribbon protein involved in translation (DUF1610 family)